MEILGVVGSGLCKGIHWFMMSCMMVACVQMKALMLLGHSRLVKGWNWLWGSLPAFLLEVLPGRMISGMDPLQQLGKQIQCVYDEQSTLIIQKEPLVEGSENKLEGNGSNRRVRERMGMETKRQEAC